MGFDKLFFENAIRANYAAAKGNTVTCALNLAGMKFSKVVTSEQWKTALRSKSANTILNWIASNLLGDDEMLHLYPDAWKAIDFRFVCHKGERAGAPAAPPTSCKGKQ
jgi:hypothetical protein